MNPKPTLKNEFGVTAEKLKDSRNGTIRQNLRVSTKTDKTNNSLRIL